MTNFEFYKKEILENAKDGTPAFCNGKFLPCVSAKCDECMFNNHDMMCSKHFLEWGFKEHKTLLDNINEKMLSLSNHYNFKTFFIHYNPRNRAYEFHVCFNKISIDFIISEEYLLNANIPLSDSLKIRIENGIIKEVTKNV